MLQLSSMNIEKEAFFVDSSNSRKNQRMLLAMQSKVRRGKAPVDSLGRRVRDLRQAYEWGQEDLADKMAEITGQRVGQGYISDVERGRANPNWKTIAALAQALETTSDYLVMLTDNPAGPGDAINHHWSEQADEAGQLIDELPEEWRILALEEVKKIDAEWKEIQRQDKEISTWLDRVEAAGGEAARAIAEQFVRSRLTELSRGRGGYSMIDKSRGKRTQI
jgi:transcriptional regulator with XRE-family HTH domain